MGKQLRLIFVCSQGHIFRSLKKLKNGRLRQCPVCAGVVEDSCKVKNMVEARLHAQYRIGNPGIQVFVNGKIERRVS